ncbi:MAG: metal-sensing transcriptional repressor [Acidobacteria bacterium]|nr:metal-sensing transcriptional repressor [Acidobacteriota bacterium]
MTKASLMTTKYLTEEDRRSLLKRLNRAAGQINALRRMVEESECVDTLLIQISAAKAALTQAALELMEQHLVNCAET